MAATTFNAALEQLAIRKFTERKTELRVQIGAGAMSPEMYKLNCGIVKGLEEAEKFLIEAMADIQKAGRGA